MQSTFSNCLTMMQAESIQVINIKVDVFHVLFLMIPRLRILDEGFGIFDGPKWGVQDVFHGRFNESYKLQISIKYVMPTKFHFVQLVSDFSG